MCRPETILLRGHALHACTGARRWPFRSKNLVAIVPGFVIVTTERTLVAAVGGTQLARPPIDHDLSGKVCIVTGASSGIGKEIARNLARMGATVMMGSHDYSRGEEARLELVSDTKNQRLVFCELDLARQVSIRQFVGRFHELFDRLDVLVHNAALWFPSKAESPDGFELVWAANVLGPHLLTKLLRDTLIQSAPSRVIFVSSNDAGGLDVDDTDFDRRSYTGDRAYRQSKHAVRLMSASWSGHLAINGVLVNCCSPGSKFKTNLYRRARGLGNMMSRLTASPPAVGADTPTYLAAIPDLNGATGKFYVDRKQAKDKLRRQDEMNGLWHLLEHQTSHLNRTRTDVMTEEEQEREKAEKERLEQQKPKSATASFADLFKPPTAEPDPEDEDIEVEDEQETGEDQEVDIEEDADEESKSTAQQQSSFDSSSFIPALQLTDHSEGASEKPKEEKKPPVPGGQPLYLQYMKKFGKD